MPLVLDSSLTRYNIGTFSGKVLDVPGRAVADRVELIQYDANGGPNQEFYVDPCGADVFRIIARHSGRVLDLSGPDGAGAPVWQFAWAAVDNQRWRIEHDPHGAVVIASEWNPDLVMDIGGNNPANEAPLIVWHRNGQDNQRFHLKAVA
jgi:hypothetical protein